MFILFLGEKFIMKQTKNALSMLLNAYRAIYKSAFIKGLATAAVLTAGLSAAVQAAPQTNQFFESSASKDAVTVSEEVTIGNKQLYATDVTVNDGGNIKSQDDGSAAHLYVTGTLTVNAGGAINLSGGNAPHGILGIDAPEGAEDWESAATSALKVNGGTVNVTKSQIQMANVDLTDATVTLGSNGGDNASSDWSDNSQITALANGEAGAYTDGVMNINGTTTVQMNAGSVLNARELNINDGTITMAGTSGSGESSVLRAHSDGVVNIAGGDVTVTGNGAYIVGKSVVLDSADSAITVQEGASLTIGGALNKNSNLESLGNDADFTAAAGEIVNSGTMTVKGTFATGDESEITNTGTLNLNGDADLSAAHYLRNEGTINFSGDTLTLDSENFLALFAQKEGTSGNDNTGKLVLDENAEVQVEGNHQVDLTTSFGNIAANGNNTLYIENVKLGTTYNSANLTLDVNDLTVQGKPYPAVAVEDNAFVLEQGTITVSDIINLETTSGSATGDGADNRLYVYAKDSATTATLNLQNDGSITGNLGNLDRIYVGYAATSGTASGSSVLNVDGHWDFGDVRLTVNSGGSATLAGVVDNIGSLAFNNSGTVDIANGATVEVGRLLGNESNAEGAALNINGTLTITGDGVSETANAEGKYSNDFTLGDGVAVTVNTNGVLDISAADVMDDIFTVEEGSVTVAAPTDTKSDLGGWTSGSVAGNGKIVIDLTDSMFSGVEWSKDSLESLKGELFDDSFTGLLEVGNITYDVNLEDGLTESDLVDGVVVDKVKNETLTTSSDTVNISTSVGNLQVSGAGATIVAGKTVELNNGANGFVTGGTDDNLTLKSGSAIVLNGSGTVGDIKQDDGVTSANVALNAQGGTQNVGDIDVSVAEITAGTYNTGSVTAATLNITGGTVNADDSATTDAAADGAITATSSSAITAATVNAGIITLGNSSSATDHVITSSVVNADSISLQGAAGPQNTFSVVGGSAVTAGTFTGVSGAQINVGTDGDAEAGVESSTGALHADTLQLNGAMLVIDPSYNERTAVVSSEALHNGTLDGDVSIGMNSAFGVGFSSSDELLAQLTEDGLRDGIALREDVGAVAYFNDVVTIASDYGMLLDPSLTTDEDGNVTTSITDDTITLAENSAIVISKDAVDEANATGSAVITFEGDSTSHSGSVAGNGGQVILSGEFTVDDKNIKVFDVKYDNSGNPADGTLNITGDDITVTTANGALVGTIAAGSNVEGTVAELTIDEANFNAYARSASTPMRSLLRDALEGDLGDGIGASFLREVATGSYGSQASDADVAARLATFGGAIQATNAAQQTSVDAVAGRMGVGVQQGGMVFADNQQGGGLWLMPVYKNHDSDEFDADGIDYGADIDLYGVALGADFTTDSGVRVGGYFNVGSGDADGQGVASSVSNDFDYFGLGIYAGMNFNGFELIADAGFTQVSNDIDGTLHHNGVDKLTADTDTTAYTVGFTGQYAFKTAFVDITPHLGVRYTHFDMDSYDVKADGVVLASTDADGMDVCSIPFGVTFAKDFSVGAWQIKPALDLTVTANAGDTEFDSDTAFVGAEQVTALSAEVMDDWTYGGTLGVDAKYGESLSFGVGVSYVGSESADEFGVTGNIRYMF